MICPSLPPADLTFCYGDEPKSELARDLGDRLQSRNVPFGTFGDCIETMQKKWTIEY